MAEHDQAHFWDNRYRAEDYVFGTAPNAFLSREAHRIPAGSQVLAVADGEGRNSVFLAEQGFDVVATDISERGLAKARRLAAERGVEVDFRQIDVGTWGWPIAKFDAIVAIFIQFADPSQRATLFENFARCFKPGGILLMQGYRPEQLAYGTGGPPLADSMYTEAMLRAAFDLWDIELLESHDSEISEGCGHSGMSALIDLIAQRPS
ncbi:SAM-dependent methyltransferase [Qipengyuania sp. SM2507]